MLKALFPRSFVAKRPFPRGQALVGSPGLCLITPRSKGFPFCYRRVELRGA
jgi:hypothetical protein